MLNVFRHPCSLKRRLRTQPLSDNWVTLLNYWEETHPYPGYEDKPYPSTTPIDDERVKEMLEDAANALGLPYTWGGKAYPYFDCSGFVGFYTKKYGLIPQDVVSYTGTLWRYCYRVTEEEAKPGDLVFYYGPNTGTPDEAYAHVGFYLGEGNILDCSGGGVQYRTVHYHRRFFGYFRIPGVNEGTEETNE